MATSGASKKLSSAFLLISGSILIILTFLRFGIGELAWIVYAPLLVFVHERRNFKQHLLLFGVLAVAYTLTVGKIVTSEIPWMPAPMFGVPMAFFTVVAISVAGLAHRILGTRWGVYTFASVITAIGWIQYNTPLSSWGILAHTQIYNLSIVQLSALTGVGGITFLVALGSGLTAATWSSGFKSVKKDFAVFAIILLSVLIYGEIRMTKSSPGEMIRVGGVVSPVTHKEFREAVVNVDTLRSLDNELFARSAYAAKLGAKVIVWNEVATVVSPEGEKELAARARSFAKDKNVLLCMAYAVLVSKSPFWYSNKYRIYLPDGTMADEYIKRHPVPGDQHDAGDAHARVVSFDGFKFSGGICYDYSFPSIALDNASEGAEIVLLPSSDWSGIDFIHSHMARMHSVAVGLPMMRPVRASTSIATDQYGRILGSLPWQGSGDGVFVVSMRGERVQTLYSKTGELVPLIALGITFLVLIQMIHTTRKSAVSNRNATPQHSD